MVAPENFKVNEDNLTELNGTYMLLN